MVDIEVDKVADWVVRKRGGGGWYPPLCKVFLVGKQFRKVGSEVPPYSVHPKSVEKWPKNSVF